MILSRITKAVREQNWFAVAIEFVIVVLGVVIGFQVNAWNEYRIDRERERDYLERLLSDIEESVDRFEGAIAFRREVRSIGLRSLDYVSGDLQPSSDFALVHDFFQASQAGGANVVNATYSELLSRGELGLITDQALREALNRFYSFGQLEALAEEYPPYRESIRGIIPIRLQDHIWSSCYEVAPGEAQTLSECAPPDIPPSRDLIERLLTDQELHEELRYWVSNQNTALYILQARLALATELRDRVAAEIRETTE
jgi:hypothetical protein